MWGQYRAIPGILQEYSVSGSDWRCSRTICSPGNRNEISPYKANALILGLSLWPTVVILWKIDCTSKNFTQPLYNNTNWNTKIRVYFPHSKYRKLKNKKVIGKNKGPQIHSFYIYFIKLFLYAKMSLEKKLGQYDNSRKQLRYKTCRQLTSVQSLAQQVISGALPQVIPEHRTSSKLWTQLDVAQIHMINK